MYLQASNILNKNRTKKRLIQINQNNIEYLNVTMKKFNLTDIYKIMQNLTT